MYSSPIAMPEIMNVTVKDVGKYKTEVVANVIRKLGNGTRVETYNVGIGSVSQLIARYVADIYGLDVAFYPLTIFAAAYLLLCFRLPGERKSV